MAATLQNDSSVLVEILNASNVKMTMLQPGMNTMLTPQYVTLKNPGTGQVSFALQLVSGVTYYIKPMTGGSGLYVLSNGIQVANF